MTDAATPISDPPHAHPLSLHELFLAAADEGFEANACRQISFLGPGLGWNELQIVDAHDAKWDGERMQFAFFQNADQAIALCRQIERIKPTGIYLIINSIHPDVAARAERLRWHRQKRDGGTKDHDISERRALYADFDADRIKGISSTDEQVRQAHDRTELVAAKLEALLGGRNSIGLIHSGNGGGILLALDNLKSTDELTTLVRGVLAALKALFEVPGVVNVDTSVSDPKRLGPMCGTMKAKGAAGLADRPHRRTAFLCEPQVERLSLEQLEGLFAALMAELNDEQRAEVESAQRRPGKAPAGRAAPKAAKQEAGPKPPPRPQASPPRPSRGREEGDRFAIANAQPVGEVLDWLGLREGERPKCPGCGESDSGVAIVQNGLKCSHNRCANKGHANGFRTVIDLVVEVHGVEPVEALDMVAEHFLLDLPRRPPANDQASSAPPPASKRRPTRERRARAPRETDDADSGGAPEGKRLCEELGQFWSDGCGPDSLVLPHGFRIMNANSASLGAVNPVNHVVEEMAASAFWPIAEMVTPAGRLLRIAAIIRKKVEHIVIPADLVHDKRKLCQALARHGVIILPDGDKHVPRYLAAFAKANELPLIEGREGMGWDRDFKTFMLGEELIGSGTDVLVVPDEDEVTRGMVDHLRTGGSAATWKATAEAMLAVCPALGPTLAASVASPLLRLLGLPTIGLCFGAIGGAGKSSILRAAASVWGWTGGAHGALDGVVRSYLGSTAKGILASFRRMPDLPHVIDEAQPSMADRHEREAISNLFHQLFEGVDRARAARSGNGARAGLAYPGCPIIAGEIDASDYLIKGGVVRRYLRLSTGATDGQSLGRFREPFAEHFGHLGRALVGALVAANDHRRWQLRQLYEHHLQQTPNIAAWLSKAEPWPTRARQLASALAAAEVTTQLVPTIAPDLETWHAAIINAWNGLVDSEGPEADESDPVAAAERKIRAWVSAHRLHLWGTAERRKLLRLEMNPHRKGTFRRDSDEPPEPARKLTESERCELGPKGPVIGAVVKAKYEGSEYEQLLVVDVIQAELTKFLAGEGYSARTLTGGMADRKFIEPAEGNRKRGEYSRPSRIGGQVVNVYRLVLATDEEPQAAPAASSDEAAPEPSPAPPRADDAA